MPRPWASWRGRASSARRAEALSGLARAFFYTGPKALLVSHWPVYSDAAVQLTTSAFANLDRDPWPAAPRRCSGR
jgi:CHAT domain-containing protein